MYELNQARSGTPMGYIRINAFNASYGVESCAMSFIAQRPQVEPGFYVERQEGAGRFIRYTIKSYVVQGHDEFYRYS